MSVTPQIFLGIRKKARYVAKENNKRKFHALYDKIYRWDVLCEAWKRVKANKGATGVDAVTLADIEEQGEITFLKACERELKERKTSESRMREKLTYGL